MQRVPLERKPGTGGSLVRRKALPSVNLERQQRAREGRTRATGAATGQPKPPGRFTDAVKLAVRKRAGRGDIYDARCEACGVELGEKGGQVHHRAGRGSGGCRDTVIQSCANAMLLCGTPFDGCHGEATRFAQHLGMKAAGVWIEHGTTPEFDPRNVPVKLHGLSRRTVWLAEDGIGFKGTGYWYQQPGAVAA